MEYPNDRPPYPSSLSGKPRVKLNANDSYFVVDFDTGECDCDQGAAWRWDGNRYKPNTLCTHKLKAICYKLDKADDPELRAFYEKSVGQRYNVFIAVSAFHKELRLGNVEKALYWATIVKAHRGNHGILRYLRDILFEETRDLPLGNYILRLWCQGRNISDTEMRMAVTLFCKSPKKWELPWRLDIFLDEMRGYRKLAREFGYVVAQGQDIIDARHTKNLRDALLEGFAKGDRATVQYGLKGWFKSKSPDHNAMKFRMFDTLIDIHNGDDANAFDHDGERAHDVYAYLMNRIGNDAGIGYHELNAFCDALTGETGGPQTTLPPTRRKLLLRHKSPYMLPLGSFRRVPLYAHDNHTWDGKAKLRRYGDTQLKPGASQTDIDFRVWGAYGGVAWRYLAYKQHATIYCKWEDVSWASPNWLWGHVEKMIY